LLTTACSSPILGYEGLLPLFSEKLSWAKFKDKTKTPNGESSEQRHGSFSLPCATCQPWGKFWLFLVVQRLALTAVASRALHPHWWPGGFPQTADPTAQSAACSSEAAGVAQDLAG